MESLDNRIVVFGAGGHAKSVLAVMHALARWQVAGLLEEPAPQESAPVLGHRVLGDRSRLAHLREAGIDKGIVAIGSNRARGRIADLMIEAGFSLITVMHPAAACMSGAAVGEGSFVHAFALVGPECQVGRNAIVQPFCSLGHESVVGDCVQFSPGVHVGGKVRIGDYAFLGPGAVVYPGVTIGRNVSIGANSVVNKDVADDLVIAGNPARVLKRNEPIVRHHR